MTENVWPSHIIRVEINWVGLTIFSLFLCAPEILVSRDVPRQPPHLHTQAESGAYLRDSSRVPRRRPLVDLNRIPYTTLVYYF